MFTLPQTGYPAPLRPYDKFGVSRSPFDNVGGFPVCSYVNCHHPNCEFSDAFYGGLANYPQLPELYVNDRDFGDSDSGCFANDTTV